MCDNMENRVNNFASFELAVKILTIVGYYEIQSSSKYVRVCHFIYRIVVIFGIIMYNISHLIFVGANQADIANITYSLVIEIPQLNLFVKLMTIFIYTKRIRNLQQLINDPIFGATNKNDARFIENNKQAMIKLTKFSLFGVTSACSMWLVSFIFRRMEDPESRVPAYIPFDASSTLGYTMSVLMETSPIPWIGYGHLLLDTIVAIYYSQATAQLKLLKYNLEHIFDNDDSEIQHGTTHFQYIDENNENIRKRFIYFLERYKKVNWYVEEVTSIFDGSMSFQLFTATMSSCLVIYQLSMMPIFSVLFLHMFIILIIFKVQLFCYCYFGYLVEYESQTINTALYFSDWLSVSPKFRRYILIAMTRWSKPLMPRVSTIVPVSVVTFVSIVKSAYRLYTVMKSTHM